MSKDRKMSRKRYCKKAAARFNIQVNPEKRRQERGATEKHLAEKREAGLQ